MFHVFTSFSCFVRKERKIVRVVRQAADRSDSRLETIIQSLQNVPRLRARHFEPRNSLHFISRHFYFATVHTVRPCCDLNTSVRHRWNPSCCCSISMDQQNGTSSAMEQRRNKKFVLIWKLCSRSKATGRRKKRLKFMFYFKIY